MTHNALTRQSLSPRITGHICASPDPDGPPMRVKIKLNRVPLAEGRGRAHEPRSGEAQGGSPNDPPRYNKRRRSRSDRGEEKFSVIQFS